MADSGTYIVRHRDLAEIIRSVDRSLLEEFMDDPLPVIAGAITEYLTHPSIAIGAGVRIAQAVLQGKMYKQLHAEIKYLKEKGTLPQDFAEQQNGFQSWTELLQIIDGETPDNERLDALKAMFFAANQVSESDGPKMLGYQLFQIAKQLRSNDLLVLKEVCRLSENQGGHESAREWNTRVAKALGHGLSALVELAEVRLVENKLIHPRVDQDLKVPGNRITDLGKAFVQKLREYHITISDLKTEDALRAP